MSSHRVHEAGDGGNGAAHPPDNEEPGLLVSAGVLWGAVRSIAYDHLRLAALEAQRAGQSLAWLLIYGVLIGVLMLSAWACAIAALMLWLTASGLPASAALLLAALLNSIAAGGFALAIRRRSRDLGFPATLRSLEGDHGVATVTEHS